MKIKKILIVFFLFIFICSNSNFSSVILQAQNTNNNIVIEDGEVIKTTTNDETLKKTTNNQGISNDVRESEVLQKSKTITNLDEQEGNTNETKVVKDPTKLVSYSGCKSGYGILQKVLDIQEEKKKKNIEEIKRIEGIVNPFKDRLSELKNKKDISNVEKKEVEELNKKIEKYDKELNQLKSEKANLDTTNLSSECVLMDIKKVSYETNSNEINNAQSYIVVNDDTKVIVAKKNADKAYNAHDFVKYYLLAMINHDIMTNNLTLDYKVKVDNQIYKIQEDTNLESVGLRINKEYSLGDMIKLLKYENYDDVMYALVSNLYGNEKLALKKLNLFLKKNVKLQNSNLTDIFGSRNDNVTSANDILRFKYFISAKKYNLVNNVSYETSLETLSKTKNVTKEGSIMDKNSNWYYSDVNEYFFSSYKNSNVSGLFDINKLNQKYSVVVMNVGSKEQLYEATTKLLKNSINYKYSNILISRKDDAKVNKLFKELDVERKLNIKHSVEIKEDVIANLDKTLALNLPEVYLDFLDIEIKIDKNIGAPKTKNDIIGKIIFKDNKYKKIQTFDNKHEISINLHPSVDVKKENLLILFFNGVRSFFTNWMNATTRINN